MQFSVWAPIPEKVSLWVNGQTLPMQGPNDRGWWTVEADAPTHGAEYGFQIGDAEQCFPDPRSPWQPEGVHRPSRTYDHSLYTWSDAGFRQRPLGSAVIYELHVGTFTPEGTFDSAIAKLDFLRDLGVTHVELMPVASFEGEHGWGYDGTALFAPHEAYGGPDGLKRLVDACHARGLAVLLDVVYNHFGPTGNYTGLYAPYTNAKHGTPWGAAINFESEGADGARRFFIDNALLWMRDYHMDGLRLDAVHEYIDRSAIHILEQLAAEVEELSASVGRPLVLIAESDLNDPRLVTSREAHGFGLDAQWSDEFHHALHSVLTGEQSGYYSDFGSFTQLAKALRHVFVYAGEYAPHRKRVHGRPVQGLNYHHFLGYIQDHDQVGNRARGERISDLIPFERAQVAAALVLTAPFVPMLFQGEEWAASTPFQYFADHQEDELRGNVREGRKQEFAAFGWAPDQIPDPEERATFDRSKLNWDEINEGDHARMLVWYRALIALRHATPALNDGEAGALTVESNDEDRTLTMQRDNVRVLVNLGANEARFDAEGCSVMLSNREGVLRDTTLVLPADSVAVLKV